MLVRTLQVPVHCEHETLWHLLTDRLQHPGRYLPGVTEVSISGQTAEGLSREMRLHGETVREKIGINAHRFEIRHELQEHPQFTGVIVTRIVRTSCQSPVAPQLLEYALELQRKSFHVEGIVKGEEEIIADLEMEMNRLKMRAEELDSVR